MMAVISSIVTGFMSFILSWMINPTWPQAAAIIATCVACYVCGLFSALTRRPD